MWVLRTKIGNNDDCLCGQDFLNLSKPIKTVILILEAEKLRVYFNKNSII